jgi:PleD family two-component response regulator
MSLPETDDNDNLEHLAPRDRYLRAKAEHYIRRAEECVQMARYNAARKFLDKAGRIEAANEDAKKLVELIDQRVFQIQHRGNGVAAGDEIPRHRRPELILLVDQNEQLLISLCEALNHYGFQVLGSTGYDEAVETMSLITPDVVISEVNFESGPRGFDLYQWMKSNLTSRSVPFLFLASRIDRETLIAGKRFGVDDFLQKPADEEVVIASILNCLSRSKAPAHQG